jgi:hypothetical protein
MEQGTMSWKERVKLYEKIEQRRKRPLIVYVTSKRLGPLPSFMATDAIPWIIEQLDAIPTDSKAVDLLIASYGGDPMVAWRISTLIRQRVDDDGNGDVSVLIPQSAYSAATLLAFGANTIIMHPNGHLGPVDMQITTWSDTGQPKSFSTEDITAFLDFVRESLKITDQEHVRVLFELICKEVSSLGIGLTARSSKLAVDLGERLLALHMKDDEGRTRLRTIVETMSRKFQSHAYPVNRKEAGELGLPVNKDRDLELEKLMWQAWLDIEDDLQEHVPFDPIIELLKSPQAKHLLGAVPQLDLPMAAQATSSFQTTMNDVFKHATVKVEPVDFEYTHAIVESSRSARRQVTKGKILSSRLPNMRIQYNLLVTSRSWDRQGNQ